MWISSVDMMAGYFGEKLRVNPGFSQEELKKMRW